MNLTREQRRMAVEYFATQCAEEMPSDDMPKAEFFQDLHSEEWRIKTMKAIEKIIPESYWRTLVKNVGNYQSFDRDPEGWKEEEGYDWYSVPEMRDYLNDTISTAIDQVARY